jgi:hypothetical protein
MKNQAEKKKKEGGGASLKRMLSIAGTVTQ